MTDMEPWRADRRWQTEDAASVRHDRRRPESSPSFSGFRLVRRERRRHEGLRHRRRWVVGLSLLASLAPARGLVDANAAGSCRGRRRCRRFWSPRHAVAEQGVRCQAGAHHRPDRHPGQAALFVVWLQDSGRIGSSSAGGTGSTQWGAPQQYGQPTYSGSPSYGAQTGASPAVPAPPGYGQSGGYGQQQPSPSGGYSQPQHGAYPSAPPQPAAPPPSGDGAPSTGYAPPSSPPPATPPSGPSAPSTPPPSSGYPQQPGPGGYGQG
jgi:hypothetical protein